MNECAPEWSPRGHKGEEEGEGGGGGGKKANMGEEGSLDLGNASGGGGDRAVQVTAMTLRCISCGANISKRYDDDGKNNVQILPRGVSHGRGSRAGAGRSSEWYDDPKLDGD